MLCGHIENAEGRADHLVKLRGLQDQTGGFVTFIPLAFHPIAQIALLFGADDLDGTVVEEKIYYDAGATTSQSLRRGELLQLIRKAGREPVERDTLYRPVTRTDTAFTVLV